MASTDLRVHSLLSHLCTYAFLFAQNTDSPREVEREEGTDKDTY